MTDSHALNRSLLQADLWRTLALAFSTPTEDSLASLRAVCMDLADAPEAEAIPFRQGLRDLAECADPGNAAALEHEHHALFSLEVLVSAYEGGYQLIDRGAVVGDVAGYYHAFGLRTADHSGPPDSLWNELAFLSWLSLKEAYALDQGMEEARSITRTAMADFLRDHLGRWAGAFSQRLLQITANPLYVTASHLLLATVSLAADDLHIPEIQALEVAGPPEEPDAVACPMGCGVRSSEFLSESNSVRPQAVLVLRQ